MGAKVLFSHSFPTLPFYSSDEVNYEDKKDDFRLDLPLRSRRKQPQRALSALLAVPSLLGFIILTAYVCLFKGSKEIGLKPRLVRRLADHGEDEENATGETLGLCEGVDAALDPQHGAGGDGTQPGPTSASSFVAGEEEGQPRGRKRKAELLAQWLQESGQFSGELPTKYEEGSSTSKEIRHRLWTSVISEAISAPLGASVAGERPGQPSGQREAAGGVDEEHTGGAGTSTTIEQTAPTFTEGSASSVGCPSFVSSLPQAAPPPGRAFPVQAIPSDFQALLPYLHSFLPYFQAFLPYIQAFLSYLPFLLPTAQTVPVVPQPFPPIQHAHGPPFQQAPGTAPELPPFFSQDISTVPQPNLPVPPDVPSFPVVPPLTVSPPLRFSSSPEAVSPLTVPPEGLYPAAAAPSPTAFPFVRVTPPPPESALSPREVPGLSLPAVPPPLAAPPSCREVFPSSMHTSPVSSAASLSVVNSPPPTFHSSPEMVPLSPAPLSTSPGHLAVSAESIFAPSGDGAEAPSQPVSAVLLVPVPDSRVGEADAGDEAVPSTSAGGEASRLLRHPYYRLPAPRPVPPMTGFDSEAALRARPSFSNIAATLQQVRLLLLKNTLASGDMEILRYYAHDLAGCAVELANATPSSGSTEARMHLPLLLLVVDALHNICTMLGSVMEKERWWGRMLQGLSVREDVRAATFVSRHSAVARFFRDICAALDSFRAGQRPSPELLVSVKRQIFGPPAIHRRYRAPRWDPWRQDDEESYGAM